MKCPFELPVRLERVNALRSEIFTKDGICLGSFPHDWAVYVLTVLNSHEKLVDACKRFAKFAAKDIPKGVTIPEEWLLELKSLTNPIVAALAAAKE